MTNTAPKSIVIIFGATGDLANRKLYPSIYNLYTKGKLSEDFAVIGVARRPLKNEEFQENVRNSVAGQFEEQRNDIEKFSKHFYYHPFNVNDTASYRELKVIAEKLDSTYNTGGNRIFYLAMAPEFFGTIAVNLKTEGLTSTEGYTRLVIEKPFGHNLPSAKQLNEQLRHAFSEDEIYRIDHYLGKEMVQNIEVIRFANAIFEPLWNNRYISNIQVTSSEVLGVEDRGGYYEKSGALRDMVQNHMLQMVALLAMDPPIKLTPDEIRSEKVKVFRAMRPMEVDDVNTYFVRGQYGKGNVDGVDVPGYREEQMVDPNSNTETFVAGKIMIDNFRWAGVPFYIRTGKRLESKSTKIVVQFKDIPMNLYNRPNQEITPNLLVIHIQPEEGITLHLNAKKAGQNMEATPIKLSYANTGIEGINTPEAYEKLIDDSIHGDATNFTHWDEVALSWSYVDKISQAWTETQATQFPNYAAGTFGPKEADDLLEKDGFFWWPVSQFEVDIC